MLQNLDRKLRQDYYYLLFLILTKAVTQCCFFLVLKNKIFDIGEFTFLLLIPD